MARAASVPVIVDAASECPPVSTLTRFWEAGADLIIFSGGKSIMGPQSTGLVIGRKDLIAGCAANGVPFATVGRPMKVSREEMIGFMKALELYLARDHEADTASVDRSTGPHRSSVTGDSEYNRWTVHQVGDNTRSRCYTSVQKRGLTSHAR